MWLAGMSTVPTMTGDDAIVECEVENTSCVICNEALDEKVHMPVALPACGHTFCKPCLVSLQNCSQLLLCPTCRQPHEGEDVAHLPPNYLVLSLLPCFLQKEKRILQSEDSENQNSKTKENSEDGLSKDERHHFQLKEEVHVEPAKEDVKEKKSHIKRTDADIENDKNMMRKDYNYLCMEEDGSEERHGDGPTGAVEHLRDGDKVVKSVWYKDKMLLLLLVGLLLVTMAVGAGVALGCASSVLDQMGFTSNGVVGKSYASKLMSSTSRNNNGTIPPNSWVSWLQNAGHKGLTPESQAVLGVLGALTLALLIGVPITCCLMICWHRSKRLEYPSSGDGIPLTDPESPKELQFSQ